MYPHLTKIVCGDYSFCRNSHTLSVIIHTFPLHMCCSVVLRVSGGWFPVEDSVWLHRMLGTAMLTALFVAPLLWIIAMGASCYGTATDSVSDLFCIMGPIYYSQRRDLKHQPLPARIIPTVIICTAIPTHTHAQAAHASTHN